MEHWDAIAKARGSFATANARMALAQGELDGPGAATLVAWTAR